MGHRITSLVTLALLTMVAACSDDDDSSAARTDGDAAVQCPGSVVRRVDGGDPIADSLPHVDDSVTSRSVAEEALEEDREVLVDRHRTASVELAEGFGRAWAGENGGDYAVLDVDDFGIIVTLHTADDCPSGAALHVRSNSGLPLFFVAPE